MPKRDLVRTEFVDKPTDCQGQDRNYKNGYTYENNGHHNENNGHHNENNGHHNENNGHCISKTQNFLTWHALRT